MCALGYTPVSVCQCSSVYVCVLGVPVWEWVLVCVLTRVSRRWSADHVWGPGTDDHGDTSSLQYPSGRWTRRSPLRSGTGHTTHGRPVTATPTRVLESVIQSSSPSQGRHIFPFDRVSPLYLTSSVCRSLSSSTRTLVGRVTVKCVDRGRLWTPCKTRSSPVPTGTLWSFHWEYTGSSRLGLLSLGV